MECSPTRTLPTARATPAIGCRMMTSLLNGLMRYLWSNVEASAASDGIYGKVWVKLTEKGYEVDLP